MARVFALAVLAAGAAQAQAQEPLNPPAPLSRAAPAAPAGGFVLALNAAQRAQDLGLPSVAAELYRKLLDAPDADQAALTLALATALLDAGRAAEAEQALETLPEPHDAAWRLRAGLAALQLGRRDAAQAAWDAIRFEDVPFADVPWYYFLTGALYDTAAVRDMTRANEFYVKAEQGAATELARARFQLAAEVVRLRIFTRPTDAAMKQVLDIYERNQGRSTGYESARAYAAMRAEAGQRGEAVTFLQQVLLTVPPQERGPRDELRFVLGIIGDRGRNGAGRNALLQLLDNGQNAERQRQALQLLAEASRDEPLRGQFRAELNRLILRTPPHSIHESLLFYRAQLALGDKDFARAEEDADALLQQYPLSRLRVHAYALLTQSAWEQRRYRIAARQARKARDELQALVVAPRAEGTAPAPAAVTAARRAQAEFAILEAEAWFRGADFRNAADTYAAVLRERPPELGPEKLGPLMFQRVLAEIKAGSPDAGKVLDELSRDPAFDVENRWQAEWSLARALQLQGDAGVREAYARINALLRQPDPGAAALKPELRARVAWLQTKLAFENNEPTRTVELAEAALRQPYEIQPGLKQEIVSTLVLLKARAQFALEREAEALETLKQLRAEHPLTDAAVSSHLIEAEHYARQEKIDRARKALIDLTDNPDYRNSEYVPYALFRLALLSEQLGREENLREANRRIEELVTRPGVAGQAGQPGQPDLLFAARLKQGDLLRKLNDFPAAQVAYEDLVNRFPHRPDVVLAQLRLAECHNAQSATDPDGSHVETAQLLFEQLRDRVDAPADVRVEAGYNLGALLQRRGKLDEAVRVWWLDVIDPFLRKETKPFEAGAKRPYWLARTLRDLGEVLEKQNRLEEAKDAYLLLAQKRLPYGEAIARARLEQFGVPVPPPRP